MEKKEAIIKITNTEKDGIDVVLKCGNETAAYYNPIYVGIADALSGINEYRDKIIDFNTVLFEYIKECENALRFKLGGEK